MSAIEDRIRDRVERLCDMAPGGLTDTPEAWAAWKRRCVSGVADIVAEETKAEVARSVRVASLCFEDGAKSGRQEIIEKCRQRFPNSTFYRAWDTGGESCGPVAL